MHPLLRLLCELACLADFDDGLNDHHYGSGVGDESLLTDWSKVREITFEVYAMHDVNGDWFLSGNAYWCESQSPSVSTLP